MSGSLSMRKVETGRSTYGWEQYHSMKRPSYQVLAAKYPSASLQYWLKNEQARFQRVEIYQRGLEYELDISLYGSRFKLFLCSDSGPGKCILTNNAKVTFHS